MGEITLPADAKQPHATVPPNVPNTPNIKSGKVVSTQDNFWGSVPQCDNLNQFKDQKESNVKTNYQKYIPAVEKYMCLWLKNAEYKTVPVLCRIGLAVMQVLLRQSLRF